MFMDLLKWLRWLVRDRETLRRENPQLGFMQPQKFYKSPTILYG